MNRIAVNFQNIRNRVDQIAAVCRREAAEITLLAVSKTRPVSDIEALYAYGVRQFGENREPELTAKAAALPGDIIWHFIGPLQSNKVRKVVKVASMIHSVESIALLERVERISGEENRQPQFLLEVNVSGELSKGGFAPEQLDEAVKIAVNCKNAKFSGFMTMAPLGAEKDELLKIFSTLREIRDHYAAAYNIALPVLSMGMSGDFPEAIECGATIVRIGTAIFA